jgi:hypothetical protein
MTKTLFVSAEERVNEWTQNLSICLEENYKKCYPNASKEKIFRFQAGRKYYKMTMYDELDGVRTTQGVHCFIDKKTGDVYKPASYRSPAPIARYNLLDEESRELCYNNADWAGGYLYLR